MNWEDRLKDLLERVGRGSAAEPRRVYVGVALAVALAAVLALSSVQMSMGMDLYIDHDSETWSDWSALEEEYDRGNNVFVVVESDQLHDPATIRAIDDLDRRYGRIDDVASVTSLADVVRAGNGGEIPDTRHGVTASIDRVRARGGDEMIDNIVPEQGTTVILAGYGTVDTLDSGAFMPTRGSQIIQREVASATAFVDMPPGATVTVTGQPPFENAAFGLMLPEMIVLFAGAFALIFVAVYLLMRRKLQRGWHVALPLGTTMTALMLMMGAMGALGFDFNAIMLGVMPIAMGLGIDYGLQMQTRYVDERRAGNPPLDAVGIASRTTGRAVLIAMATTTIGLGSLFVSSVPPVRQFGVTSAVSVMAAMALSVTLLPALMVRFDAEEASPAPSAEAGDEPPAGDAAGTAVADGGEPADGDDGEDARPADDDERDDAARPADDDGEDAEPAEDDAPPSAGGAREPPATAHGDADPVEGFFDRLTRNVVCREPKLTLALAALLVLGGLWAYPQVEPKQEMMEFWPQDLDAKGDLERLRDTVDSPNVVYVVLEGDGLYTPETFRDVRDYQELMRANGNVNTVVSPVSSVVTATGGVPDSQRELDAALARSGDGDLSATPTHQSGMVLAFYVDDVEGEPVRTLIDEFEGQADVALAPGVDVRVTGKPVLNRNVIENVTAGLTPMTLLSFGLGLLFLTLVFASARVSLLLVGGVAGSAALLVTGAMYVMGVPWNPLTVTMSSITLGVGIDYGLHVYERFEEERVEHGKPSTAAIGTAVSKLSRPILGSSLTTIAGFGVLVLSRFPVLRNFGWTTVLAMAFSVTAAMIVLPALLVAVRVVEGGERCGLVRR